MCIEGSYNCEIIALETPKVIRNCHQCRVAMEFYCSEKFRVNAQQKHIDVWLIYKCVHCASTWNYPILSRVHTASIDKELHNKLMSNDREMAWTYAFQLGRLRQLCSGVNTNIDYVIRGNQVDAEAEAEDIMIHLSTQYRFDLRLDKVLKEILGVSRSRLYEMADCGRIQTNPQVSLKGKVDRELQILIVTG